MQEAPPRDTAPKTEKSRAPSGPRQQAQNDGKGETETTAGAERKSQWTGETAREKRELGRETPRLEECTHTSKSSEAKCVETGLAATEGRATHPVRVPRQGRVRGAGSREAQSPCLAMQLPGTGAPHGLLFHDCSSPATAGCWGSPSARTPGGTTVRASRLLTPGRLAGQSRPHAPPCLLYA